MEHIRDELAAVVANEKRIHGDHESKAKNLRNELEKMQQEHEQQKVKIRAKYVFFLIILSHSFHP